MHKTTFFNFQLKHTQFSSFVSKFCIPLLAFLLLLLPFNMQLKAQTNPTAQTLPLLQTFGSTTFTSMPAGFASWNGLSGASITTQALAEASTTSGNATITTISASTTTGGTYGYASATGDAATYIQTSTSGSNGVNQLVFAVNIGTNTAIRINFDIDVINVGTGNTMGSVLQYRLGNTGGWTTVAGSAVTYNSTSTNDGDADAAGDIDSYEYVVSGLTASTAYQFRFAHWRTTAGGNSVGIAYDNIDVRSANEILFLGTGSWTAPAGIISVAVEAWGAGGSGGGNTSNADGGGGGGGGAYVTSPSLSVVPGTSYTVTVGAGATGGSGAGAAGGDSWFNTTGTLLAKGGSGGATVSGGNPGAGGNGGSTGASVGSTKFAGGNGGTGVNNNTGQGGPGGSSAGTATAGTSGAGTWSTVTAAAAPTGGGIGGNGGTANNNGNVGGNPGGGGGGSGDGNRIGGNGYAGRVIITRTCPTYSLTATTAVASCAGTGATINITGNAVNLPLGTYTVTYNLAISNVVTGATATFTVTTAGAGSFTTGNLANSGSTQITITSLQSGGSSGCTSAISTNNTATFSVGTAPTATAAGPNSVCQSATPSAITLSGASVGGSATTGAWSITTGGGTLSSIAQTSTPATVTYTPAANASGTVTLTLTSNFGSGCTAATSVRTITINATPTAVAGGPNTVCQSGTPSAITLSGASVGGSATTGAWAITTGAGMLSSTAQTGTPASVTYTPAANASGTVTLTLTSNFGTGCTAATAVRTINITQASTATAGGPNAVCQSVSPSAITLSGASVGGFATTGAWSITSGGGTLSSTAQSASPETVTYTPAANAIGTATLTLTSNFGTGCTAATAVRTININGNPAITASASASTICSGASVTLSSEPNNNSTTLLSENFNAATNTWIKTNNSTGGTVANAAWTLRGNGYTYNGTSNFTFNSNDNSQFYLTNSDAQNNASSVAATLLQSPVINTVGYSTLALDFYHYYNFNSGASDRANVQVSTNGTTWTDVAVYSSDQGTANNFAHPTINLNAYIGNPVLYIRFKYDATDDWFWAVDNVTLSGTPTANTYSWSSTPTGFSATSQNPTVSPTVSTDYTVTVTNANGCSATAATGLVTVNNAPSISIQPVAPTATCTGTGTQVLDVTAAGAGLTYSWRRAGTPLVDDGIISGQGTATLTLTNPIVANAGTYDVLITGTCSPTITSSTVIVTVNQTPATPGSISGSTNVCQLSSANVYSVSPVAGATTYTWTVPTGWAITAGQNTNSITVTAGDAGQSGSITVTAGNTCGTSSANNLAVSIVANTWTGATNNSWNTASNWSCGVVPASGTDVEVLASATFKPQLTSNTVVNNLNIASGATLSIGANTLTINAAVTGTGTLTGSDASNLTLNGTAGTLYFTSGSTNNFLKNFTINSTGSATLGNALNITGGTAANTEGLLTVATSGVGLTTNGFLTFKSNIFGTANIAAGNINGGYISGNVTIERFIPQNNKAWRLLASNTTGQTIKQAWQEGQGVLGNSNPGFGTMIPGRGPSLAAVQALGFDTMSLLPSIYKYNPATDNLDTIGNLINMPLAAQPGYFIFVRGDRSPNQFVTGAATTSTTLRSSGSLFQGNQAAVSAGAGGYALMRNPYPSRLDMRQIARTGTDLSNAYQIWDPKLNDGGFGVGGFETFVFNTATSNYEAATGGGNYTQGAVNNYIESGAAFFIISATDGTASTGTASVLESSKATGSNLVFRPSSPASTQPRLYFNLSANTTSVQSVDGGFIDFNDASSNAIDAMDIRKNPNFTENFGIKGNDYNLVVERRALLVATDTINFDFTGAKRQPYQLRFRPQDLVTTGLIAFLEDRFLNTLTPLSMLDVTTYDFVVNTVAGSSRADRFRIVFKPQAPLPVMFTQVRGYQQGNNITVEWKVNSQLNMSAYQVEKSTDGRNFFTIGSVAARGLTNEEVMYNWLDVNAVPGANFYRVKGIENSGSYKYSNIVKVIVGKSISTVTVAPNPVENGVMNVQLQNQPKGKYELRLANALGQIIYNGFIQHPGGSTTQSVELPSAFNTGTYQLEIIAPNKGRYNQQVLIQSSK